MCDRQHMDAAQDLLMQYRGFAAFNASSYVSRARVRRCARAFTTRRILCGLPVQRAPHAPDGKLIVASMLSVFIVAETRFVTTVARPPRFPRRIS